MHAQQRWLITGANGFVGSAVCRTLTDQDITVLPVVRRPQVTWPQVLVVEDIGPETRWDGHLEGIDVVVHAAARVHITKETDADPLQAFRRVNTEGTINLARAAARAGVTRFVFVSSVKVSGEVTYGEPFNESEIPEPIDPYGVSKWEAEQALLQISRDTGLEVAIVRPTLVYGPGVKANFLSLLRLANTGIPLPFANCENKRSMVALPNLVDAILRCGRHPSAAGQAFFVSDGEDLSTGELIARLRHHLGRPKRLVPAPLGVLRRTLQSVGRSAIYDKLYGSLQVDIRRVRQSLGWHPPYSVEEGLKDTVRWYLSAIRRA